MSGIVSMVSLAMLLVATGSIAAEVDLPRELGALRRNPLAVVELNRELIARTIARKWRRELIRFHGVEDRAVATLVALPVEQLHAAALADSFLGVQSAIYGQPPARNAQKALGDPNADLTFTPVAPCRILDTRSSSAAYAGYFVDAGVTRDWKAVRPGGSFSVQGGENRDCGIPAGSAAILANVAVALSESPGNVYAWAFQGTPPIASVLNYAAGQTIANAIVIPLARGLAQDFSTMATARAILVVDVMGYFSAPTLPPVVPEETSASINLSSSASGFVSVNCTPGALMNLGGCKSSSALVYLTGSYFDSTAGWTCEFTNTSALIQPVSVSATCGEVPARAQ